MPELTDLTVGECMFPGVISCGPEATLEEVVSIMRDRHVSAVVVVRDGGAIGIISRTDLVNTAFVEPYLRHWRGLSARHLMSTPVISIRPEAPLTEALAMLRARRIHRLLVSETTAASERPVGVLALADVLRALGEPAAEPPRRRWP